MMLTDVQIQELNNLLIDAIEKADSCTMPGFGDEYIDVAVSFNGMTENGSWMPERGLFYIRGVFVPVRQEMEEFLMKNSQKTWYERLRDSLKPDGH